MILRCRILAVVLFVLAAAVPARGAVIVAPNANAATEGATSTFIPFDAGAFTLQWVFDDSQFAGIPLGSKITGIGFRLNGGTGTSPASPASFSTWDLQISQSLNAPGSLSATYADNIAADVVLALSGPLTLAASSFTGGAGPNPFTTIAFTMPYTYVGGDLLLTLRHSTGSAAPLNIDAVAPSGLTDTVGTASDASATTAGDSCGGGPGTCLHFFNAPVSQFVFESATPMPLPGTLALVGLGLAGLAATRRRRLS